MTYIRRCTRSVLLLAALAALLTAHVAAATTETSAEKVAPDQGFESIMLNAGVLDRLVKAETSLASVGESDPTLVAQVAVNEEARADWLRRIHQRPKALEALRSAGVTPDEYITTVGTLVQTYKVVASQKASKPVPQELVGKVPQANIDFVSAHVAEIDAWKRGGRAQGSRPNTMEDIYSAPPAVAAAPPPASQPEKTSEKDKTSKKPSDKAEEKP